MLSPWLPGPAILTDVRISVHDSAIFDPAGNGNVLSYVGALNTTVHEIRFLYHSLPPPKFNIVPIVMLIVGFISVIVVPIVYINYMKKRIKWEVERGIYRDAMLTLVLWHQTGTVCPCAGLSVGCLRCYCACLCVLLVWLCDCLLV